MQLLDLSSIAQVPLQAECGGILAAGGRNDTSALHHAQQRNKESGSRKEALSGGDDCRLWQTSVLFENQRGIFPQKSHAKATGGDAVSELPLLIADMQSGVITVKALFNEPLWQVQAGLLLLWVCRPVVGSLCPRQTDSPARRKPKKSVQRSCGRYLNCTGLANARFPTGISPLSQGSKNPWEWRAVVVVVVIMAGMITAPSTANQPQEGLGTAQVIAIMSSELFEVTSCMTSWFDDLLAEQMLSCIKEERMTSSLNIVVIHSAEDGGHRWPVNTTKQITLWLLLLILGKIDAFDSKWQMQPVRV